MAKPTVTQTASVISLFRDTGIEDDTPLTVRTKRSTTIPSDASESMPLSGEPVWIEIGGNNSGKTVAARWIVGRAFDQGRSPLLAALDPQQRSLAAYFAGTLQPPVDAPLEQSEEWLGRLVEHLMENKRRALLDLGGGGDAILTSVVARVPDLAELMEAAGMPVVAAYFLSPRIEDLSLLANFEAAGFQPKHTALILNYARVEKGLDPEATFAAIRKRREYREAIARGAVEVRMPRLEQAVSLEIERKKLPFSYAASCRVPEGSKVTPISGIFDRSRINTWLAQMDEAFAPVRSWLL